MSDRVIVSFPGNARPIVRSGNPALVLVLPVVRVERHPDDPVRPGRRRRSGLLEAAMEEVADKMRADLERRLRGMLLQRGPEHG